jgi:mono/diheme cytochrome c family protein
MRRSPIALIGILALSTGLWGGGTDRSAAADIPTDDAYYSALNYLEQGWSVDTANWWYFLSQGTVFVPYDWFLALEQAKGQELLASPGNMSRLGFLVDPPHPEYNPDGLPVGFAKRELALDKGVYACWQGDWVGFGCAACHTGQVNYRGHQIRIEGGAAHHDIEAFQTQFGEALGALASSETKFTRFAGRLLSKGIGGTPQALQKAFSCFASEVGKSRSFFETAQSGATELPTASGFGRLDAHERGLNLFLAGPPVLEARNYVPETAPVSFPAIWDTPYFDWVLYNASIRQPLARNIVEALGVQAPIDHSTIFTETLVHSVNVDNIAAGQKSMMDLMSPPWPEQILGAINQDLAAQGRTIYEAQCAGCHAVIDRATHASLGESNGASSEIAIPTFPLEAIGTDPRQAVTFANRKVDLSKIGGPAEISSFAAGQAVTEKIVSQWIAESPENAALADEVNQGRANEFRGELRYRARPLNGIWATAPYLHNGSVANLEELLIPAARRSKVLYMGNWDFDPVRVGYESSSPFIGASILDTRLPGNSNAGHEFGTDPSPADRAALIEYLKTL